MSNREAIRNLEGAFRYNIHYKCRKCGTTFDRVTNEWSGYYQTPYYVLFGEDAALRTAFHECSSEMIGIADLQGATKRRIGGAV